MPENMREMRLFDYMADSLVPPTAEEALIYAVSALVALLALFFWCRRTAVSGWTVLALALAVTLLAPLHWVYGMCWSWFVSLLPDVTPAELARFRGWMFGPLAAASAAGLLGVLSARACFRAGKSAARS